MIRIPILGLTMATASILGSIALGLGLSGKGGQVLDRLFPASNAPTIAKPVETSTPARTIAAARSDRTSKPGQSASKNIASPTTGVANREPTASPGAPATPAGNYAWSVGDGATVAIAGSAQAEGGYAPSGGVSAYSGSSSGAVSAGGGYAAPSTGAGTASAGGSAGAGGSSGAAGGSPAAPGGNVPATAMPGSSPATNPVAAGPTPSGGGASGPAPSANPGNPGAAPVANTPAPVATPTLPVSAPTPAAAAPAPVSAPAPVAAAPTASLPVSSGNAPANSSGPANPNNFVQTSGHTNIDNMNPGSVNIVGGSHRP